MGLFGFLISEFLLTIAIMTTCWLVFKKRDKAQVVDIGWALSFFGAGCLLFLGSGSFSHQVALFLMIALWSLRLAYHLYNRFSKQTKEDPRYIALREKIGGDPAGIKFLILFWLQGILVTLLSIPFFVSAIAERSWSIFEWIGIFLFGVGIIGESLADWQLKQFKRFPSGQNVLKTGLWAYSRHPNFFFEWIIWLGFSFFVWTAPFGSTGIISALIMLYLLLKVSGIPVLEEQEVNRKGEEYRIYQRSVSAFFPWFPK